MKFWILAIAFVAAVIAAISSLSTPSTLQACDDFLNQNLHECDMTKGSQK